MSLTMSLDDDVTVLTITTNPKSKWPLLCQILGNLCYSPVCSVAHKRKGKLTKTLSVVGIVQMIVGVICIVVGTIPDSVPILHLIQTNVHFWLGAVCLSIGIVCVLAAKFPSPCLLFITVILNIVSPALVITVVMLCLLDLTMGRNQYCDYYFYYYYYSCYWERNWKNCQYSMNYNKMILGGIEIMVIVLAFLQLCVTMSFFILTLKFLCKKSEIVESVEDPRLYQQLLENAG